MTNPTRPFVYSRAVPSYKQRIAGKSLPTEKFVIRKSARFFSQGERLSLAALELLYIWNLLKIVGKEWSLIQPLYRIIERTIKDLDGKTSGMYFNLNIRFSWPSFALSSTTHCLFYYLDKYYYDDLALALLLKGCCLRSMGSPLQAEECFLKVSKMEKVVQDDTYLIPFSVAELGFLYNSLDRNEQAIVWLEAAK